MQLLGMLCPPCAGQGLRTVLQKDLERHPGQVSPFYRWELGGSETCRFPMWLQSQDLGSAGAENEAQSQSVRALPFFSVWRP